MNQPPAKCEAVFDRLGPALLAQAYQLLVPERRGPRSSSSRQPGKDPCDADRRDLRPGLLRPAKRAADHPKPDRRALLAHAATLGLDVPPEWVFEDEGYSGATLYRPALERLRDLVCQVPVEVVLCYAPDRLARKYAYQALLVEELGRAGTEVRFVNGPAGDRPEDLLLVQFQGMIAEYEKAQIIQRTRRGKAHRAKQGSVNVLSGAPYGYRYVRKSDHAEARYEPVEPQARVVGELFRRYTQAGLSIADLARWLTAQQIPTATGKARWDRSTVWGMLRNPAYAGRAALPRPCAPSSGRG